MCIVCESAQLDRQSREAEHFSQQLLRRSPAGLGHRYPSAGSLLDKLELPNVTDFQYDEPVLTNGKSRSDGVKLVVLTLKKELVILTVAA
jgi:hypothetical protein